MCSIAEGDLEELRAREAAAELRTSAVSAGARTLCQKCRAQPAELLLRVNDIYCRACFLAAVTHKFRSTLGKSRLLRPEEPAAVAFSGGPASAVLARLLRDGVRLPGSRRLRLRPALVLVDETAVLPAAPAAAALRVAAQYGFAVYRAPLERAMGAGATVAELVVEAEQAGECREVSGEKRDGRDGEVEDAVDGAGGGSEADGGASVAAAEQPPDAEQLRERLRRLWAAAGSGSAREQLRLRLRTELLARAAAQLGSRLLLLAETETRLAVRLLADLAGGRGAHAHQQTALADRRYGDTLVLRPLREISAKQTALFAHYSGVEYVAGGGLDTAAPVGASIERVTEAFVQGLQANFPATVSTVYKTGTKLSAVGALASNCALCRLPLDTGGGPASALQATRFSQLVSNSGPDSFEENRAAADGRKVLPAPSTGGGASCGDETSRCEASGGGCCGGCSSQREVSRNVTRDQLMDSLCYGCQLTMRDMKEVDCLPEYVQREAAARSRMESMRKEIQEFLIEDS